MEDYRVIVGADTLFGAFCWAFSMLYGEDELKTLLSRFVEGNPPFLISSMFPAKKTTEVVMVLIPVPRMPIIRKRLLEVAKKKERDEGKAAKLAQKVVFGTAESVKRLIVGRLEGLEIVDESFLALGSENKMLPRYRIMKSRRVALDRLNMGSTLFRSAAVELGEGCGLVFWLKQFEDDSRFLASFRAVAELGVGGERSIGLGASEGELLITRYDEMLHDRGGDLFCTLSPYSPTSDEAQTIQSYLGELGYAVVERTAMYSGLGRFSCYVFEEGSVLPAPHGKLAYGRMMVVNDGLYRYGYAFPVMMDAAAVTG
jgi:CRISPR-associated protein Csm4